MCPTANDVRRVNETRQTHARSCKVCVFCAGSNSVVAPAVASVVLTFTRSIHTYTLHGGYARGRFIEGRHAHGELEAHGGCAARSMVVASARTTAAEILCSRAMVCKEGSGGGPREATPGEVMGGRRACVLTEWRVLATVGRSRGRRWGRARPVSGSGSSGVYSVFFRAKSEKRSLAVARE